MKNKIESFKVKFGKKGEIGVGPVNREGVVAWLTLHETREEKLRNAKLLASAPDMLNILQTVLSILESPEIVKLEKNGTGILYYFEQEDIEDIKRVLNKATGQE